MKTRGKVYWARIIKPDTKWDNHMWCATLHMSKEEAKPLKDLGLKVTLEEGEDDKPYYRYKFRRYVQKRGKAKGKNKPPFQVDPAKKPFDGIIGNGSEVVIVHKPYKWNRANGTSGWGTDFVGIQVLNLVPYEVPEEEGKENPKDELVVKNAMEELDVEGESFTAVDGEEEIFDEEVKTPKPVDEDPF